MKAALVWLLLLWNTSGGIATVEMPDQQTCYRAALKIDDTSIQLIPACLNTQTGETARAKEMRKQPK